LSIADEAEQIAVETMEKNDQAEKRFQLWSDAWDVGVESKFLGFGPGPHLKTKQWKKPPPEKNEAHNTVLDIFTQGGLLAALSFLWITAVAFLAAYRANLVGLTSLVVAILVLSSFHLISRHPFLWFSLALCLSATDFASNRGGAWQGTGTRAER